MGKKSLTSKGRDDRRNRRYGEESSLEPEAIRDRKRLSKTRRVLLRDSWNWSTVKESPLFRTLLRSEYNRRFKAYLRRRFKKINHVSLSAGKSARAKLPRVASYVDGRPSNRTRLTIPVRFLEVKAPTIFFPSLSSSSVRKKYWNMYTWRNRFKIRRFIRKDGKRVYLGRKGKGPHKPGRSRSSRLSREAADVSTRSRRRWLEKFSMDYKRLTAVERYNFLKTLTGQLLTLTHIETYAVPNWLHRKQLRRWYGWSSVEEKYREMLTKEVLKVKPLVYHDWLYGYFSSKKGNNQKVKLIRRKKFRGWPRTRVWWSTFMLFKHKMYYDTIVRDNRKWRRGTKVVMRDSRANKWNKDPRWTNRNQFYYRYFRLLIPRSLSKDRPRSRPQSRYMHHLINRSYRALYGLTLRQMKKLESKSRRIQSYFTTQADGLIFMLEKRLDVCIYRLNWAPTVFWARRLIYEGNISVNNISDVASWIKMYSSFKICGYPLKLRDPCLLYRCLAWHPSLRFARYKSFLTPMYNESYLVKSTDLIQYQPPIHLSSFKIDGCVWNKKVPGNFLVSNGGVTHFEKSASRSSRCLQTRFWQQAISLPEGASLVSQVVPEYHGYDRVRENFVRWIVW